MIFEILLTVFQVSYQTNLLLSSVQRFSNVSSKHETVDALHRNTENASADLWSAVQFSNIRVFFGLFLNSPLIFYIKSQKCRPELVAAELKGIHCKKRKMKKTWLRETITQEPWKNVLHLKRCLLLFCFKYLSACFSQQNFMPHLGHLIPCFSRSPSVFQN